MYGAELLKFSPPGETCMFLVRRLPPLKGGGSNLIGDLTGFITTEHIKVKKKLLTVHAFDGGDSKP